MISRIRISPDIPVRNLPSLICFIFILQTMWADYARMMSSFDPFLALPSLHDSRIEETNTLRTGGLAGASNTLGAALYYVDYALRMLQV